MGNPLFVRTSVGVINLALVTQIETIGERMIFVFLGPPAEKEIEPCVDLPLKEGEQIISRLISSNYFLQEA